MDEADFLADGGAMGAMMRAFDWSQTDLGPVSCWPQSLRTSVSTCLNSRLPILIWWGPHYVKIYNDAYAAILGEKHPRALGQRGRECWPEIWHIIGPRLDAVLERGEATGSENELLLLDRRGFHEECYFTFSYSPIRDETGIGGVFCAVTETTRQVLSERRLNTLRDLAARAATVDDEEAFWHAAVAILAENRQDVPFALLYHAPDEAGIAALAAADGFELGPRPPQTLRIPAGRSSALQHINVVQHGGAAALLPLRRAGAPYGYLVAGLSARRRLDREYSDFLILAADHISAGIANARAHAEERKRVQALAELDTLMQALPVGVFIARDRDCNLISANAAGAALLRLPRDANVSKTGAQRDKLGFRVLKQGHPVAPSALPMQRAAQTGQPVVGEELDIVFDNGDAITLYEYATPLVDAAGEPRGSVGVFVDITERKQTERILLQQKALLELVAAGCPVAECLQAICEAAPALNPGVRACILLADPTRRRFATCISASVLPSLRILVEASPIDLATTGACGESVYRAASVTCPDIAGTRAGSEAWRKACLDDAILACHCEPILGADGVALGCFMLCLDRVRAPREAEQRLAQFAARIAAIALERDRFTTALLDSEAMLREADQRKDEFLATLSHELRNPLAPLSNALQLLRCSAIDSEPNARIHDMMRRQVDHLVRLVDDLLETSRITRGVLELRKQRIEVAQVVKNAIESIEPMMQAAQHELQVVLPQSRLWLEGDPVRLAQVLGNLLNNAAKYTAPRGRIVLHAQKSADRVRIAVRDNGRGIESDALPRVFDMFRSGRPVSGLASSGLGIGLALARRLAEMHGGTLEARSEGVGKGAEFIVSLPLANELASVAVSETSRPPGRLQKAILVVDDNVDAAESLGMLLTALGAEVRLAHDGSEALRLYGLHRPAAVLLDIGMPQMDGYEVARRIRAQYPGEHSLLIALTGWGQESDRRKAHAAGFDHHLVKPVDFNALQELLYSLDAPAEGASARPGLPGGMKREGSPEQRGRRA